MKLLLIDDSAQLRHALAAMLLQSGRHDVREAGNLAEGLDTACDFQPDAIVLDDRLPDGLGSFAVPLFRAIAPAARLVIFSATLTLMASGAADVADAFVQKGSTFEDLMRALNIG